MGNKISKAFPSWNFTLNIFHVLYKTVWYAVDEQFNVTGAPCLHIWKATHRHNV